MGESRFGREFDMPVGHPCEVRRRQSEIHTWISGEKKKVEVGVPGRYVVAKVNRMTQKDPMTQIKQSKAEEVGTGKNKGLEVAVLRGRGVVKQNL